MARATLGKQRGTLDLEGVATDADMARLYDALASRLSEADEYDIGGVATQLAASGTQDIPLRTVPAGKELQVYVVVVEASGFTPGAPFNGAAGAFVSLHRDNPQAPGTMIEMSLTLTGLLPIIFSFGSDARIIRSSQTMWLRINGGPVTSPSISVSWQAKLRPTVTP